MILTRRSLQQVGVMLCKFQDTTAADSWLWLSQGCGFDQEAMGTEGRNLTSLGIVFNFEELQVELMLRRTGMKRTVSLANVDCVA